MHDTDTAPACDWQVRGYPPLPADADADEAEAYADALVDHPGIIECGAPVTETATGWHCAAGHEHVTAEARRAQGWDYAEDDGDAMNLTRAGVEPRALDGGAYRVGAGR